MQIHEIFIFQNHWSKIISFFFFFTYFFWKISWWGEGCDRGGNGWMELSMLLWQNRQPIAVATSESTCALCSPSRQWGSIEAWWSMESTACLCTWQSRHRQCPCPCTWCLKLMLLRDMAVPMQNRVWESIAMRLFSLAYLSVYYLYAKILKIYG